MLCYLLLSAFPTLHSAVGVGTPCNRGCKVNRGPKSAKIVEAMRPNSLNYSLDINKSMQLLNLTKTALARKMLLFCLRLRKGKIWIHPLHENYLTTQCIFMKNLTTIFSRMSKSTSPNLFLFTMPGSKTDTWWAN